MDKAIQLLESLLNGETVKRFEVYINRFDIYECLETNINYRHLGLEVDLLVDMARESL